jgi:DNA-binding LacI/PurR family transcriptional regulator
MPHFFPEEDKNLAIKVLEKIPKDELVILDKDLPDFKHECLTVYQDFERDVAEALEAANDLMAKYQKVVLVFPSDGNYPIEIVRGVRYFCVNSQKEFVMKESVENEILQAQTAYLVVEETDLADLVKKARMSSFVMGQDIGIISFNETTLKELLGITVITTDFETMGRTAAALLLDNIKIKVKNPFYMIRRETL